MKKVAAEPNPTGAVDSRRVLILILLAALAIPVAIRIRGTTLKKREADLAARQQLALRDRAMQIASLRKAITAKPDDLQAHRNLLALYQKFGMQDAFVDEYVPFARLQPDNQPVQLMLAGIYGTLRNWPKAVEQYTAIVNTWPQSVDGWQGLSLTFYSMKQYNRAIWAAQHAAKLQPHDPHVRFGLAASTLEWAIQSNRMGNHSPMIDSALQELNRLLPDWSDKAGIHFLIGKAYYAEGFVDRAIENLQEANRLSPHIPDIATVLTQAYMKQQRWAEARAVNEQALAKHPKNADLLELLGQLELNSGGPDADQKALTNFQKAVTLNPKDPAFQERLGSAYLRANDLKQARTAFEESIRIDPNRPYPFQQLALLYTRLGDKARAAKIAEAARELAFNEQQLKRLQSLVLAHPENVLLHLALADRYRELGANALAADEYLAARHLDPNNARVKSGLNALLQSTATPQRQ